MSDTKTVKLNLRQDFRLEGVLYRQGNGVEMPESVATKAGLYTAPAPKPAPKRRAKAKSKAKPSVRPQAGAPETGPE